MTRFAWLQSRAQTLTVAAVLAALAITAAITGVQLAHLYDTLIAHCQSGCGLATGQFLSHDHVLEHTFDLLSLLTPALLGIFWGAPLLTRELETGTHRLAWTQSVTRSRWLLAKLAVVGLATVTIAGLLTLTITWWYRDIDKVGTNQYAVFDRRDIVPVAYAAFAFATGAFVGAVVRRTLPAMATTLGVFTLARIAVTEWVRPHLLSPLHATMSLLDANRFGIASLNGTSLRLDAQGEGPHNSWTLASQIVTNSGHVAGSAQLSAFVRQYCPPVPPPPGASPGRHALTVPPDSVFQACRGQAAKVFHLLVTYQPASRYWTFQWLETGIFLALALAAVAGCYWWVTRRTS